MRAGKERAGVEGENVDKHPSDVSGTLSRLLARKRPASAVGRSPASSAIPDIADCYPNPPAADGRDGFFLELKLRDLTEGCRSGAVLN